MRLKLESDYRRISLAEVILAPAFWQDSVEVDILRSDLCARDEENHVVVRRRVPLATSAFVGSSSSFNVGFRKQLCPGDSPFAGHSSYGQKGPATFELMIDDFKFRNEQSESTWRAP